LSHFHQQQVLFSRLPSFSAGRGYSGLFRRRWLYHLLFWLAYFSTAALIALNIHQIRHWTFFLQLLSLLPPDMAQVYLNIYVLIPLLLFRRRYFLYFTILLTGILLQSALFIWLHRSYALSGETAFAYVMDYTVGNFIIQSLNIFSLVGLATGIKFLKDWMLQEQRWREREKQHIETELNFLRSQIHPHFFFNTLNNLYSLTIRKSDQAPEVVLKLSHLMSYMLYESGAATVPLEKEVLNLENYMSLEQLRFGQRLTLCFEKKGDMGMVRIPPLLLLAFVENGFKHGLKAQVGPVRIDLSLDVQKEWLFFEMSNPAGGEEEEKEAGGIGLKNAGRRLDILYGARYALRLTNEEGLFKVQLKIPLS
jgi:two-component system LytT family sensor kinase